MLGLEFSKSKELYMKKSILVFLVFLLAACGVAPIQQVAPTPIVVTVLVPVNPPADTAVPTMISLPTEAPTLPPPTETLIPTPTEISPTQTPQVIVVTATVSADTGTGLISIDDTLGKGVFVNMTMSSNVLTLRCNPREITFNITANLPEIVEAQMYYRIVDNPAGLYPSEWQNAGEMKGDGKGNYSIVFSGEDVNANLRLDKAWLDVQFIGLNKGGGAVDRTQKIERLITYGIDCQ